MTLTTLCYLIKDNKYLMLHRTKKEHDINSGKYIGVGGHIEEGENQYEALVREAKEELGITIEIDKIINSYVVLRRNYFKIDGKQLEPYIDYYFEINEYTGTPKILEKDKCDELIWTDINNLPEPFINYEGDFLEDRSITTYDCRTDGAYKKTFKNAIK